MLKMGMQVRKLQLAADVDLDSLANDKRCDGFTGADLAALVREAGTHALRRIMQLSKQNVYATEIITPDVCQSDFGKALSKVFPSVSKKDLHRYRNMQKKLRGSRAVMQKDADEDNVMQKDADEDDANTSISAGAADGTHPILQANTNGASLGLEVACSATTLRNSPSQQRVPRSLQGSTWRTPSPKKTSRTTMGTMLR